jgi:hypothetical protein
MIRQICSDASLLSDREGLVVLVAEMSNGHAMVKLRQEVTLRWQKDKRRRKNVGG